MIPKTIELVDSSFDNDGIQYFIYSVTIHRFIDLHIHVSKCYLLSVYSQLIYQPLWYVHMLWSNVNWMITSAMYSSFVVFNIVTFIISFRDNANAINEAIPTLVIIAYAAVIYVCMAYKFD